MGLGSIRVYPVYISKSRVNRKRGWDIGICPDILWTDTSNDIGAHRCEGTVPTVSGSVSTFEGED